MSSQGHGPLLITSLLFPLVLGGCASSTPTTTTIPGASSQLGTSSPISAPPSSTPTIVSVSTCCTATLPAGWAAPKLIANGLYGTADPKGTLTVTWQIVGTARSCPLEPPALLASLVSPTHPSGDVIIAVDPMTVNGKRATVYITTPNTTTPRAYQYANADAALGSKCVDLGAAEYGVASATNLGALLQILATTRPVARPLQP